MLRCFFAKKRLLYSVFYMINCLLRCSIVIVFIKKAVFYAVFFVCDDRVELHVFYALKDTLFNVGVTLFKLSNKEYVP